MARMRVLITVKTYPSPSLKYEEIVCTADFREDGTWIRIYPYQFRSKEEDQQYDKYDWVEWDLIKNNKDLRPESYRPYSYDTKVEKQEHIDTNNNWAERKKYVLQKVYYNLKNLINEAKNKSICTSLAVFKPTKILDFKIEETEREWNKRKIEKLEAERKQNNLFNHHENIFNKATKIPYKFSYIFEDDVGIRSCLMIEDWEIGMLYLNCLRDYNDNEQKACDKVHEKYFDDFTKMKDVYLFLGTTLEYHFKAPNPFIIVGVFYPKKEIQTQENLF